jgi:hypothetical protein
MLNIHIVTDRCREERIGRIVKVMIQTQSLMARAKPQSSKYMFICSHSFIELITFCHPVGAAQDKPPTRKYGWLDRTRKEGADGSGR